jgi:hypothetical protein
MSQQRIDRYATVIPANSGLPSCLFLPIAARDLNSIQCYVGKIVRTLSETRKNAFLVQGNEPERLDRSLPIWDIPRATLLHQVKQVWVHVDYQYYRKAYMRAFPNEQLTDLVLDHILNRRVARLKGFNYLRIVPIDRPVNSSHGRLCEDWS